MKDLYMHPRLLPAIHPERFRWKKRGTRGLMIITDTDPWFLVANTQEEEFTDYIVTLHNQRLEEEEKYEKEKNAAPND